ncbi:MAG TPA: glutamine-hydrolyzing carbamoyl-phosphate synthase small subunit, partial [Ktedonobacterales bacterium]|nr:glutamine-hydrolyzing carbamoyl-phosphate synthase small subunit [Ktedonobacterales bacterium]
VAALAGGRRGEVVFATSMTGYQEICTDPSYRGQMVVLTYPIIGSYGVAFGDDESRRPWLAALLVREYCDEYSNWRAAGSLGAWLKRHGIPGVSGLDTRALTRHLRASGTLRGVVRAYAPGATPDLAALVAEARGVAPISARDVVAEVASAEPHLWRGGASGTATPPGAADGPPRVLLVDTGFKHNIARSLHARGLEVVIAPAATPALLDQWRPDGVVLANGPGDPEAVPALVELARALIARRTPLLGICLGHQVIALAAGARTLRLPFGHHGSNHPVREVRSGRVSITAQNHNFAVDGASVASAAGWYVSHLNLSDGSVEGLAHEDLPVFSVQFHPEAAPGPEDNQALFDRFAALLAERPRVGRARRAAAV